MTQSLDDNQRHLINARREAQINNSHRGHGAAYHETYDAPAQLTPERERQMLAEMRRAFAEADKPLDETTRVQVGDIDYDVRIHALGAMSSMYRVELTRRGHLVIYDTANGPATFDRAYTTRHAATQTASDITAWLSAGLTPAHTASLTIDA